MVEDTHTNNKPRAKQLVSAKVLLEELFDHRDRPSLRWLRQMQANRTIPYIKIGHRVFFDVEEVREALDGLRVSVRR